MLSVKNCKLFDPPKAESSYNLAKYFMKPENGHGANKIGFFTKLSALYVKKKRTQYMGFLAERVANGCKKRGSRRALG